jgi:hypothetical protein
LPLSVLDTLARDIEVRLVYLNSDEAAFQFGAGNTSGPATHEWVKNAGAWPHVIADDVFHSILLPGARMVSGPGLLVAKHSTSHIRYVPIAQDTYALTTWSGPLLAFCPPSDNWLVAMRHRVSVHLREVASRNEQPPLPWEPLMQLADVLLGLPDEHRRAWRQEPLSLLHNAPDPFSVSFRGVIVGGVLEADTIGRVGNKSVNDATTKFPHNLAAIG